MAYVEVDIQLDNFSDYDILDEVRDRMSSDNFSEQIREMLSNNNINDSELIDIAKNIQAKKDVTEKLRQYIWDRVGLIV